VKLSPNFYLHELTVTQQLGPDGKLLFNQPIGVALDYLRRLCEGLLEPVRLLWGCPVIVTSGYRSREVELAVSGKDTGQHRLGQAADIVPAGDLDIEEAYRRIAVSSLQYDQLLLEGVGDRRWIHISCAPPTRVARRQALLSPDGKTWAVYQPPTDRSIA
jgi:hypothetical protein